MSPDAVDLGALYSLLGIELLISLCRYFARLFIFGPRDTDLVEPLSSVGHG